VLGGVTLSSAYLLDARSLAWAAAPPILTVIGLVQVLVGAFWILRAHSLRRLVAQRPGTLAAATILAAIVVVSLGGSGAESAWVTSAQTLLVACGALLPRRGLIVTAVLVTALPAAVWVTVDGASGGYRDDGNYLVAIIALAKFVGVGLLLGSFTGTAWRLLGQWHVVERYERGVVQEVVRRLQALDRAAAELADRLAGAAAGRELEALRARLARGLELRDPSGPVDLASLMGEITTQSHGPTIHVELSPEVRAGAVDVLVADALAAAVRRQLDNVIRHAPNASRIDVQVRGDKAGEWLELEMTDDGGGRAPAAHGAGTRWSSRQLARVDGRLAYFDGPAGTGLRVTVPTAGRDDSGAVPVRAGLERFAERMIDVLRWSSYVGDTLAATGTDGIGNWWLLMPAAAIVIELVIQRGLPGIRLDRAARQMVASGLVVALTLAYALPAGAPDTLVPVSTSVVIPAQLLLQRQYRAWFAFEVARALAVAPFVVRGEATMLELVVIYPLVFNAIVLGLRRFIDGASTLEDTVLNAMGRTALAGATLRGLALHHDAIDVLLRAAPDSDEVRAAGAALEDAVRDLAEVSAAAQDQQQVVRSAMAAAASVPVHLVATPLPGPGRSRSAAPDRVTLVELAALAAEERAACAPPGLFGRRRLRALHLTWETGDAGDAIIITAEPALAAPDRARTSRLAAVAATLGLRVDADAERLIIQGAPS
jgi:hypothetical protein